MINSTVEHVLQVYVQPGHGASDEAAGAAEGGDDTECGQWTKTLLVLVEISEPSLLGGGGAHRQVVADHLLEVIREQVGLADKTDGVTDSLLSVAACGGES